MPNEPKGTFFSFLFISFFFLSLGRAGGFLGKVGKLDGWDFFFFFFLLQ